MNTETLNMRYSKLATTDCCLSCGSAITFADAAEGEICVDLGSGKGNDVLRLADKVGATGHIYGVDASDGMIETARKNAAKFEATNVSFLKSDLEDIHLNTGIADLVISNCTINHASDKNKVWSEIYRILKPGGRFVISDIYSLEPIPEQYRNDPQAVAECWAGAVTKNEYLATLDLTGFAGITILEESAPYDKGKTRVSSVTIAGMKPALKECCNK